MAGGGGVGQLYRRLLRAGRAWPTLRAGELVEGHVRERFRAPCQDPEGALRAGWRTLQFIGDRHTSPAKMQVVWNLIREADDISTRMRRPTKNRLLNRRGRLRESTDRMWEMWLNRLNGQLGTALRPPYQTAAAAAASARAAQRSPR